MLGSQYAFNLQSSPQSFDLKGEKRELIGDDKEEPWWHSFKSQLTQKSTEFKKFKSSQQEAKVEASSLQTDKSDDENESKSGKI